MDTISPGYMKELIWCEFCLKCTLPSEEAAIPGESISPFSLLYGD